MTRNKATQYYFISRENYCPGWNRHLFSLHWPTFTKSGMHIIICWLDTIWDFFSRTYSLITILLSPGSRKQASLANQEMSEVGWTCEKLGSAGNYVSEGAVIITGSKVFPWDERRKLIGGTDLWRNEMWHDCSVCCISFGCHIFMWSGSWLDTNHVYVCPTCTLSIGLHDAIHFRIECKEPFQYHAKGVHYFLIMTNSTLWWLKKVTLFKRSLISYICIHETG